MLEQILSILSAAGLVESGFCPFSAVREKLLPCRALSRLPAEPQTVICTIFPYYLGEEAYRGANLSRYAAVPDYHVIAGTMLENACAMLASAFPAYHFAAFVDNSPIPEGYAAACAGLGKRGKNGLLLHPVYGSWIFLGEIVTDLPLDIEAREPESCENCGRCVAACPSGALRENGFDAALCLSARTQKKGALDEETAAWIRHSGCAWGCDLCQLACPHNQNAAVTPLARFLTQANPCASIGAPLEGRAYAWRGRSTIERNLALLPNSTPPNE